MPQEVKIPKGASYATPSTQEAKIPSGATYGGDEAPNAGLAPVAGSKVVPQEFEGGVFNTDPTLINEGVHFGEKNQKFKAMPGSSEGANLAEGLSDYDTDVGTHAAASGKDIAHGEILKGIHEGVQTVGTAATPFTPMLAGGNPVGFAKGAATAYTLGKAFKYGGKVAGAGEDAQNVLEDAGNAVGGGANLKNFFRPKKVISESAERAFNVLHPGNASSDQPSILPEIRAAAANEAAANPGNPTAVKLGAKPKINVPKGKEGVRLIGDVTQKAIDAHEAQIEPVKQQFSSEAVDNSNAGSAARSSITPEMRVAAANGNTEAQNQIGAIEEIAQRAEGAQTVGTADDLRHTWNDELHGDYSKSEGAKSVAPVVTQAKRSALNALRGNFYNRLGELTGNDYSGLAKREGLLMEAKEGVTKTGDKALESKGNDLSRFQAVRKAAKKISVTRPGTLLEAPEIVKAAINPESQTPVGEFRARTKRALKDLSPQPAPSPTSFPGGRVATQPSFPDNGPLFSIPQTPVTTHPSAPALPFGSEDLLQPGSGSAVSGGAGPYSPNQPVAAAVDPQTRAAMEAAPFSGYRVGSDEVPNFGQTRRPLVTEEHPEINALPREVEDILNSFQNPQGKLPPQGSIQLGPSSLGVSGGSQAADTTLPPPLQAALGDTVGSAQGATLDTSLFQRARQQLGPDASLSDVALLAQKMKTGEVPGERRQFDRSDPRNLMNAASVQAQVGGILQRAGLRIGRIDRDNGTVTFEDPRHANRFAIAKLDDLMSGGPSFAQRKIHEVVSQIAPTLKNKQ